MNQSEGQDMVGRWIANNVSVLLMAGGMLVAGAVGYTRLESQVANLAAAATASEAARQERIRIVDARLTSIDTALARAAQTEYRVTSAEEAIRQTNQSFNATVATISERLAEMNQQLGALTTSVAVLTQRIEAGSERRTELRVRPPG